MSKKHFIAMANWIADWTGEGSDYETGALNMVLALAPQFNTRFDKQRFEAWIAKRRKEIGRKPNPLGY